MVDFTDNPLDYLTGSVTMIAPVSGQPSCCITEIYHMIEVRNDDNNDIKNNDNDNDDKNDNDDDDDNDNDNDFDNDNNDYDTTKTNTTNTNTTTINNEKDQW